jgi:hypothetical protein
MNRGKVFVLSLILAGVYALGQYLAWTCQTYDYLYNYMYEFTSPKMRSRLAAGHQSMLADLAMIRGIQFYGRNYPLFDKHPVKYEQFMALGRTMAGFDPRDSEGCRFWGFALTSASRGKEDSYRFLMASAHRLSATQEIRTATGPAFQQVIPDLWKVAKDAGYMAYYELKNATPEWGCSAYRLALKSPECPDFVERLVYFACKEIEPDPLPPLMELAQAAARTDNKALHQLNVDHIRRIVAAEHKTYWDEAQRIYKEIHGASPTRMAELRSIPILKEAANRYREQSKKWFVDDRTRLFPNLMNPDLKEREAPMVKEAVEPEQPIEPWGGKYVIITIMGKPNLLATGPVLQEREAILDEYRDQVEKFKAEAHGLCPPDVDTLTKKDGFKPTLADQLGYPVLYDPNTCAFSFPPISEDSIPPLNPYGKTVEELSKIMPPVGTP